MILIFLIRNINLNWHVRPLKMLKMQSQWCVLQEIIMVIGLMFILQIKMMLIKQNRTMKMLFVKWNKQMKIILIIFKTKFFRYSKKRSKLLSLFNQKILQLMMIILPQFKQFKVLCMILLISYVHR